MAGENMSSHNAPLLLSDLSPATEEKSTLAEGHVPSSVPNPSVKPILTPNAASIKSTTPSVKTHRKHSHNFIVIWWMEIASLVCMVVALAAIIIVLAIFNGRPLPEWPLDVTVNTLVAVFLVVLKTCMAFPIGEGISQSKWLWYKSPRPLKDLVVFDDASRGPYGAMQLIFAQKGAHWASIGGVLVILSLAIDPFTQQVIQTKECPFVHKELTASIARTSLYTAGGQSLGAYDNTLDLPMQAALYQGLYGSTVPTTPFACSTGNCTFSTLPGDYTFSTLGMCSHCVDISTELRNYTSNSTFGYEIPGAEKSENYGPRIVSPYGAVNIVNGLYSKNWPQELINSTMVGFTMISKVAADREGPISLQCGLYPCVRKYKASIASGRITEELKSTSPMTQNYSSSKRTYFHQEMKPCLQILDESCEYEYSGWSVLSFRSHWGGIINGNLSMGSAGFQALRGKPEWALRLADNYTASLNNTSTAMAHLSDALTAHIRISGSDIGSAPAIGQVVEIKSCINVQWAWLSMPITTVFLTIVFMVIVIFQSNSWRSTVDWKGSVWALLFSKVVWASGRSGRFESVQEASASVGDARVRLEKGDIGWSFVEIK